MPDIWFWQRILTPHMMGLAVALGDLGINVTYIAQGRMSNDRKRQGWLEPESGSVRVEIADEKKYINQLVVDAPGDSIHICQGIRANGLVGVAHSALQARGLTHWVVMETVKDDGWRGVIKRFEYARLFRKKHNTIAGVLATGYRTPEWVIQRGVPAEKVFPFAYFLDKGEPIDAVAEPNSPFRFIFVGQFVPGKRLDWLITALGEFDNHDFELVVIGSGPLEDILRNKARDVLGGKVNWIGRLPSSEVRFHMARANCLVLPSLYDGWGAVVSESLMCGTPVVCSDTCGSAGIVEKSKVGGVFKANNFCELKSELEKVAKSGRVSNEQRAEIVRWSDVIAARAGAQYLANILASRLIGGEKPHPPWSSHAES